MFFKFYSVFFSNNGNKFVNLAYGVQSNITFDPAFSAISIKNESFCLDREPLAGLYECLHYQKTINQFITYNWRRL